MTKRDSKITKKTRKHCPFRKVYARSGNQGLNKMKTGNRLPGVTAVFLLEIMCLRDKAEKLKSGRWKK